MVTELWGMTPRAQGCGVSPCVHGPRHVQAGWAIQEGSSALTPPGL